MTERLWAGVPAAARWTAWAGAAVLGWGTLVHVEQLAVGGLDPYPLLPGWLAAYFVSLTVLDPLAGLLLAFRRRAGLVLGCAILLTDALANGYAVYGAITTPGLLSRIGQACVSVLAVALLAAAPWLNRWLWPVRGVADASLSLDRAPGQKSPDQGAARLGRPG